MRKFILIGTVLLASTAVHAEAGRGLVMASAETTAQSQDVERSKKLTVSQQLESIGETRPAGTQTPPVAATPVAEPQKAAEHAKPVAQPGQAADQPAAAKPDDARSAEASPRHADRRRVARKHNRGWTEGRIRNELARYGIYY